MDYYCIVFVSTTIIDFCEADLLHLLSQARELNSRFGITGMLVHSGGRFMQVLEGSKEAVQTVYASIAADLRHGNLEKLADGPIAQREFASWHMGFKAPLGSYPKLPNFVPPLELPATGPLRQLLADFLAEGYLPIH